MLLPEASPGKESPSICLPRVLVAMSATFWKASKKAAAATTVVLKYKQMTQAWGMSLALKG